MSRGERQLVPGVLDSLSARRRRAVLDYLSSTQASEVPIEALVDHVVDTVAQSPAPDREAVVATLHHRHLPKLDEEGLVDYDAERGSVTTTAGTELAEPYLEVARRWERESDP